MCKYTPQDDRYLQLKIKLFCHQNKTFHKQIIANSNKANLKINLWDTK